MTWCVLYAFLTLEVLSPMQRALAAERRAATEQAVRTAHTDALGDAAAVAGYMAKMPAKSAETGNGASVPRPVATGMRTDANGRRPLPAPMVAMSNNSPAMPAAQPTHSAGGAAKPAAPEKETSLLDLGSKAGSTVGKASTAMPATLASGVGKSFALMDDGKPRLFDTGIPTAALAKADTGAGAAAAKPEGARAPAQRKKGAPPKSALPTASTSAYIPPGGQAGNNGVDPVTGKLAFSVALGAVPGFSLDLEYSNKLVSGMADTWNYDAPTGDAGLGWGVPGTHMRIMRAPSRTGATWNDTYLLDTGSAIYQLKLIKTGDNGIQYYEIGSGSRARVERHPLYWMITDTSGVKYYFGNAYRDSDDTGSETTTAEYKAVCSALKAWMSAAASTADSCGFSAIEAAPYWGTWQGPSAAANSSIGFQLVSTAWNLSAIEGLNNKRTTLFYLAHMQPINASGGPTFTKASYLYKIKTDDLDQIIVGWSNKLPREIPDPKAATAEPDAYQEKMQVLYLASATTSRNGTPVVKTTLDYNGGTLLNDDATNYMGKRILTAIAPSIYDQNAAAYVTLPGWSFSYWGQNTADGVAVSRWNSSQAYNSAIGAQYGMLKTALGPSGATASYSYKQQTTIASKALTVSDLGVTSERHARFGPGYVLVGGTTDSTTHRVALYSWTSTGWVEQLSMDSSAYFQGQDEAKGPAGWDITSQHVAWAAAGDGMAAVLLPNSTKNNNTDTIGGVCSDLYLFYQNADNPDQWLAKKLNTSATQICGWAGVAVGNGMVAVAATGLASTSGDAALHFGSPGWMLWRSNDWHYVNQLQTDAQEIDDIYGAKLYQGTFDNPIDGTLASATAQIGEGFVGFYLTGKDNDVDPADLQMNQTYTAEFLFLKGGEFQGTSGVPQKVVKADTIAVNFMQYVDSRNQYAPQYLAFGPAMGESPNVSMWVNYDLQAINLSAPACLFQYVCLSPLDWSSSTQVRSNLRGFFTESNWQTPIDANVSYPADNISLTASFSLLDDTVGTPTYDDTAYTPSSALLSSDIMDFTVMFQALISGGSRYYVARNSCSGLMVGPHGYTGTASNDGSDCLANYTSANSVQAYADGVLAADADWLITNPYGSSGETKIQHILYDPEYSGVKFVKSAISTANVGRPANTPVEQEEDGLDPGNDASTSSSIFATAGLAALISMGDTSQADVSSAGLALGIGLAVGIDMMLRGGQYGADVSTEQIHARSGTLGNHVFYLNQQAEIRNADDTFTLIALDTASSFPTGTLLSTPIGVTQAYIPATIVQKGGSSHVITQASFKNGDIRRQGNTASSDPLWETVNGNTTMVTEQSTVDGSGASNAANDIDKLSSPWAFIAYAPYVDNDTFNFAESGLPFTIYAVHDGSAAGAVMDTVVATVVSNADGVHPMVQSYTYYNDADASKTARFKDGTGVYGRTEIVLTGITSATIGLKDTSGASVCVLAADGSQVALDQSVCTSASIAAQWYVQADGRLESVAYPGRCLTADTTASSALLLTGCDASQAVQAFSGKTSAKMYNLGLPGQCLSVTATLNNAYDTAAWVETSDPDANCSAMMSTLIGAAAGAAGKVTIYSYAGAADSGPMVATQAVSSGYLQYPGPGNQAGLPNVSATPVSWTAYQSSLLGRAYKTDMYRQGESTPYSSQSVTYQIEYAFSNSVAVATQSLDRNVSVASASSTVDGVTVNETYDYNAVGQLRAVHQLTQQLQTSANSGTIAQDTLTKRQSNYVYYAWEVPAYTQAMLKDNLYAPVYLSYTTLGTGTATTGTLPAVTSASAVTYAAVTRADQSTVMLPQATYTARGNSIAIPNQVRFGLRRMGIMANYMMQTAWDCLEYTDSTLAIGQNCVSASSAFPADSLYTLTRIPDLDDVTNYNIPVKQSAWMLSPSAAPGSCLTASADTQNLVIADCNTTNTMQIFYMQERFFEGYGYVTELRSLGLKQCLYGAPLGSTSGVFGGWMNCIDASAISGNPPSTAEILAILPANTMLMRGFPTSDSNDWGCLETTANWNVTWNGDDCADTPSVYQQYLFHANGFIESLYVPNYGGGKCLIANTLGEDEMYYGDCTVVGMTDIATVRPYSDALTFVPAVGNTTAAGLFQLLGSYTGAASDDFDANQIFGGECFNINNAFSDCGSNNNPLIIFNPQPTGTPQGMIAPGDLADTGNWIIGAKVLATDATTLLPVATAAYLGVNAGTNQLMSVNGSAQLSIDGRGLPVASFGQARADKGEAGYLGFESYEVTEADCGDASSGDWSCSGGATSTDYAHTGNVAYGGTSAFTVSYTSITQASDYTGGALPYIASMWVWPAQGKTCTLGFAGEEDVSATSATGDNHWYYLELVVPASTALSGSALEAACSSGGYVDDIAFRPMNGGISVTVYDSTRQYQPIATLGDGSLNSRTVLDEFGLPYFSYVRAVNANQQEAGTLAGGFILGGNSRLQGFAVPNGAVAAAAGYSSATPNSVVAIGLAPETAIACNALKGRWQTGCDNLTTDTGYSKPGKSFVIRGKFAYTGTADTSGTASIGYGYTTLWAPTLTFAWTSASSDASRPNGTFTLTDKSGTTLVSTGTIQWPRDWVMVAMRDAVLFFGDGKLLLSHEGTSGSIEDDFGNSSVIKLSGMSITSALVAGTPSVAASYLDAAGRHLQTHALQSIGTAQDSALVDVATANLYDGWGGAAVSTLSMYYTPGATYQDTVATQTRLLAYRPSLLGQFNWTDAKAIGGDLVDFYQSGAGADLTTSVNDPYYAFSMITRYMEPSGRANTGYGAGWALSAAAAQPRAVTADYDNWSTAALASDAGISDTQQASLHTASATRPTGASLTTYSQGISDVTGSTGMRRRSWIDSSNNESTPSASEEIWSAVNRTYFSTPSASGTGIGTTVAAEVQQLLPNYFQSGTDARTGKKSRPGADSNANFVQTAGSVDLLGQWQYTTGPNTTGASHVFTDDLGRVRFYRANPSTSNSGSQGVRYVLYDPFGRISETGILYNTDYGSDLSKYAALARDANLDQTLANRCPIKTFTYDVDPRDGTMTAYGNWRGRLSKVRHYTGEVADAPTSCSGHDDTGAYNEIWYQYDSLGRVIVVSETRHAAGSSDSPVFRTTARAGLYGNRVIVLTYPTVDQTGTANAFGLGSSQVTYQPDVMGDLYAVCDGYACAGSSTVYYQVTANDWRGLVLSSAKSNGAILTANVFDLRGALTGTKVYKTADTSTTLFNEQLRYLQTASNDNPCAGNPATSPNWSGGLLIGRQLDGSALPSADQGVWDCYTYDGAGRQVATSSSKLVNQAWQAVSSYVYRYDPNGNLSSYTKTTAASAAGQGTAPRRGKAGKAVKAAPGMHKATGSGNRRKDEARSDRQKKN